MQKFLFMTLFIIIATASHAFCDTIYLENGKLVKGTITRQTSASVTIETEEGQIKIRRVNIIRVALSKTTGVKQAPPARAEDDALAASAENDPLAEPGKSAATSAPAQSAAPAISESQWNAEHAEKQNSKTWAWGIGAGGDMWTMDGK